MDNARRYTRERQTALALQRSLLPQSSPAQDAVRVASAYRPANELGDIGGDWFDVIALSGARVALVVGEVTGHGIDAVGHPPPATRHPPPGTGATPAVAAPADSGRSVSAGRRP
ncbi:putative phosphatase [Streptomyces sp. NBRC 110611]|uniref:PP2C family protein-serine/threonine phosphatase n=1 Tax=Streptomyces sp. NBRC 110611 TaxID=1621259 RepID=UPI00082BD69A|nr:putative phosphatase [Streptomyces sp. NBRC 110611]